MVRLRPTSGSSPAIEAHASNISSSGIFVVAPQALAVGAPIQCEIYTSSGKLVRSGEDLSIITYGAQVHQALTAAKRLAEQGIEADVLDQLARRAGAGVPGLRGAEETPVARVSISVQTPKTSAAWLRFGSYFFSAEFARILDHPGFILYAVLIQLGLATTFDLYRPQSWRTKVHEHFPESPGLAVETASP